MSDSCSLPVHVLILLQQLAIRFFYLPHQYWQRQKYGFQPNSIGMFHSFLRIPIWQDVSSACLLDCRLEFNPDFTLSYIIQRICQHSNRKMINRSSLEKKKRARTQNDDDKFSPPVVIVQLFNLGLCVIREILCLDQCFVSKISINS